MQHPLDGQTVLITGGGSGIGRLVALGAARRGARVIVWGRTASTLESVRDEITAAGGRAGCSVVDVSDREAVAEAADDAGPVDVVVNNAGVVTGSSLLEASDEAIERTYRINVLPLYWTTRAFLPGMLQRRRGTVVTVSSAAGLVGVARQTDYSASKFAGFGFAESLRHELAGTGVNSLVVCPYYIDTGMFDGVRTRFPRLLPILRPEYVARKTLDSIEAGRQELVLPRLVGLTPLARALPTRAFDAVVNFLGINHTMDHFAGHNAGKAGSR